MAITHTSDPQRGQTYDVLTVATTCAVSGNNTIIAAPGAGYRLKLHNLQMQLEAAAATTVLVKSGSTTIGRLYMYSQEAGRIKDWPVGRERRLGENEALIFNLSGANQIGYEVEYEIERI